MKRYKKIKALMHDMSSFSPFETLPLCLFLFPLDFATLSHFQTANFNPQTQSLSIGAWKVNFPHFVTTLPDNTSTNHHKWLHLTVHTHFRAAGLPHCLAGERVSGVSGLAWFRSGHAGVRWAIDPPQQALPPGDSFARTTHPSPLHSIDFLPWRSAVTAGPDI